KDEYKISLDIKDESINYVLKKALQHTPYEYKIAFGTVLISSKKTIVTIGNYIQSQITRIVKSSDGTPLIGATVSIKNQANSNVKTNDQGRFSINAIKGDVLFFSFMGFQATEVLVQDQNDISVQLE